MADDINILKQRIAALESELEQTRQVLAMFRSLVPAGAALLAESDFDTLSETITAEAMRLCSADGGSLFILKKERLEYAVFRNTPLKIAVGGKTGKKTDLAPLPLYDAKGQPDRRFAAVRVALTGETLSVPDVYALIHDFNFDFSVTKAFDEAHGYRTRSMLVIPLTSGAKVVGVLQLINARNASGEIIPFTAEEALQTLLQLGAAVLTARQKPD
jgi:transcriptional regulator with GAF, ATPase, and Fis domain